jgi:succinate dehydrogenase/fumarate reductase flavoprotein subunit
MDRRDCDVLVIGTGASGAAAALTCSLNGLDVLVVEKEDVFGGTTVYSGGWLWAPGNFHQAEIGVTDSAEGVRGYIRDETKNRFDETKVESFLQNVPRMVEFFENNTSVKFFPGPVLPDYHSPKPGSLPGGRSICALPINGRELGKHLRKFRKPRRELLFAGLTIASGPDMKHFFSARRSVVSAAYVAKRLLLSFWDRAFYGRDLQFGNGAALSARFFKSLIDRNVPVLYGTRAERLVVDNGCVAGAVVKSKDGQTEIIARRAVVIATGGFSGSVDHRKKYFPHSPSASQHRTLALTTNTGDGLDMGSQAGGIVDDKLLNAAPWMPVSAVPYPDGTIGTFMHLLDRGKPGLITVNTLGKRFMNEGASYVDYVNGLIGQARPDGDASAWLIGDHRAVRTYGIGIVKPSPVPYKHWIRAGYLKKGDTIEDLAHEIAVPPEALRATIERFNRFAETGEDADFQRGSEDYNNYIGDLEHRPSPSLGKLEVGPFYAVQVLPGDISTFIGLKTDENARVVDTKGKPIPGLYAVGADNANVFGGAYPGGGSTLGPGVTFGFVAGEHIAGRSSQVSSTH